MKYFLAPKLVEQLKEIKARNPKLAKKIQKQLFLFEQDHAHPSLRIHKLKGNLKERWSISIEDNLRMLFYLGKEGAIFFVIGTHDEVYKK